MDDEADNCERCHAASKVGGQRFCMKCRRAFLRELKELGYLTTVPPYSQPAYLSVAGAKRCTPAEFENAVRAMEDNG